MCVCVCDRHISTDLRFRLWIAHGTKLCILDFPQIIVIGYTWLIDTETGGFALHLWVGLAYTEVYEV